MVRGIDTTFLIHVEILESKHHEWAVEYLDNEILAKNIKLAIAPQVLCEFLHIATDPRRFTKPLTINQAVSKSEIWWRAHEVKQVFPSHESTVLMHEWLTRYNLGRKRILDTQLAAIYRSNGIEEIISDNVRDFSIFDRFQIIQPD